MRDLSIQEVEGVSRSKVTRGGARYDVDLAGRSAR